jgi:hypothetical protein
VAISLQISDVNAEAWKRDVATRQAALDLERDELSSIPQWYDLTLGYLYTNIEW